MAAHSIVTQLNYALLQMAAESLFKIKQLTDAPGTTSTEMIWRYFTRNLLDL
jgi:hypothetical protein